MSFLAVSTKDLRSIEKYRPLRVVTISQDELMSHLNNFWTIGLPLLRLF